MEFDALLKATLSHRLHEFVTISTQPQDIAISKCKTFFSPAIYLLTKNIATIPNYNPRKSQNEILALANGDPKILGKLAKQKKKTKIIAPKSFRSKDGQMPRLASDVKSEPSESSSETETSEDESDYDSSGDELEVIENPPLPPTRPPSAKDAVRYDTIKAVWLPRSRPTQGDQIRNALGAFWEVAKTIRDRWKSDGEAVKKAEETKKVKEIPMLRERVIAQREMMEIAIQAAAEHGHPEIVSRYVPPLISYALCDVQEVASLIRIFDCCGYPFDVSLRVSQCKPALHRASGCHQYSKINYQLSPPASLHHIHLRSCIAAIRHALSERIWLFLTLVSCGQGFIAFFATKRENVARGVLS